MNKGITVLLLFVVLGAMGLVFYSHTRQPSPQTASGDEPLQPPSPVMAEQRENAASLPQGARSNGGLRQIDPPLSSSLPGGDDGRPTPVRITTGNEPSQTRPVPVPVPAPRVEPSPPPPQNVTSGNSAAAESANSLTPWGTPSSSSAPKEPSPPPRRNEQEGKQPASGTAGSRADTPLAPVSPAKEPVLSNTGTHVLADIGLHFSGQNMLLRIEADSPFPCKTFSLSKPDRLVIDLPGTWKNMKAPTVPQNRLIKNVRVGSQSAGPRIVLDLATPLKSHKIQRTGKVVEILIN